MGNSAARDSRKIVTARKAARALELRQKGATLDEIATELGFHDRSGARKLITRAIAEISRGSAEAERVRLLAKSEEQERRLEARIAKLDDLLDGKRRSLEEQIATARAANEAEAKLTKVHERQAKLLGADKQPDLFPDREDPPEMLNPHGSILGRIARIVDAIAAPGGGPGADGGGSPPAAV